MIVRPWLVLAVFAAPVFALAQQGPSGVAPQEHYGLRLEYMDFHPTLTGQVTKEATDGTPSLVDVKDDLNVQDERTFSARATLQFKGGSKIRAAYTKLDYQGDAIASRRLRIGDSQFEIGDRIVSTGKGNYYSAAFEFDVKKGPQGFFGLLVGGKGFDVDTVVVGPAVGKRESDTVRVPLPVVGIITRLYSKRISVEGVVSGMTLGDKGKIIEAEATARLHLSDRLAAGVGYRYLSLRKTNGGSSGDLQFGGLQFGLEFSL
jgi:hypothetical protein